MTMNKTESKAYNWLLSKGYDELDIVFQGRGTPDFLTADGKGWEIKLVYGAHTIWMTNSQYGRIKEMDNVCIVVYTADSKTPIEIIPIANLEIGKIYESGVRLTVPTPDKEKLAVKISPTHYTVLKEVAEIERRTLKTSLEIMIEKYIEVVPNLKQQINMTF